MSESATAINIVGAVGGGILAICTAPQLYKIFKTRTADDVSLTFTIMYTMGLILSATYTALIGAWAGAVPLIVECVFGCVLITAKLLFTAKKEKKMDDFAVADMSATGPSESCCAHCRLRGELL
ncbi:hypothetical protein BJ741DRAFT_534032 [Chytriomyces cf. hyalinus JEL632]|nr:hypothetical protein BJ741DRAFT_534032 [Chytriomyces cf. hyalinus JEL632]